MAFLSILFPRVLIDIRTGMNLRVIVSSDGTVNFNFPVITESQCQINVREFPMDTQICNLTFGSWTYNGLQLDMLTKNSHGELSHTVTNVEWSILQFTATRLEEIYSCCPEPYPTVVFSLEIRRKPLFYLINLVFPSALLTIMSILTFWIPMESGEKVSFPMSLMLALAIFQVMVTDHVPPSAETLPIISE